MEVIQDRNDIPSLLKPDWYCVEIGVHVGTFSEHILKNSPVRFLASVDPWDICPDMISSIEEGDRFYDYTIRRLMIYKNRSRCYRMTGQRFAKVIDDFCPNFVYIDSSHTYEETKEQLEIWWPKIALDGILAGHDYINGAGVKKAVDEFVANNSLTLHTTVQDKDWLQPVNSWILYK